MSDIFVSYASEDLSRIQPLTKLLEQRGWSVWWDRDILPGQVYSEVIDKELGAARCVVVIWSKNSIISRWVLTEASDGEARNILVPILMDDVKLPIGFRLIQTVRLIGWDGKSDDVELDRMFKAVTGLLERHQEEGEDETFTGPAPSQTESGTAGEQKLDRYFRLLSHPAPLRDQYHWTPPVDIYAMPGQYLVEVDLPGSAIDELEIEIVSSSLILSGVRRDQFYGDQAELLLSERNGNRFFRRLEFPNDLSEVRIERYFRDGVLVLVLSNEKDIH
jgi:HSP20 family molecular chaperone IbpA